ncbi:MAG: hypothetical protein MZV63_63545 [Marinilabiliales bacterium]|nr:hypothetical protein [Marinilabiliales bacterium]
MVLILIAVFLFTGGSGEGEEPRGTETHAISREEVAKEARNAFENEDWDKVIDLIDGFRLKDMDDIKAKAGGNPQPKEVPRTQPGCPGGGFPESDGHFGNDRERYVLPRKGGLSTRRTGKPICRENRRGDPTGDQ